MCVLTTTEEKTSPRLHRSLSCIKIKIWYLFGVFIYNWGRQGWGWIGQRVLWDSKILEFFNSWAQMKHLKVWQFYMCRCKNLTFCKRQLEIIIEREHDLWGFMAYVKPYPFSKLLSFVHLPKWDFLGDKTLKLPHAPTNKSKNNSSLIYLITRNLSFISKSIIYVFGNWFLCKLILGCLNQY